MKYAEMLQTFISLALFESTVSVVDSSLKIEVPLSAIQFSFSGSKYMAAFVSKSSDAFINLAT